jgi:hypothetical protein
MRRRVSPVGGGGQGDLILPAAAAVLLDVSEDHVRWLLRHGRVAGVLERRRWWVSSSSCRDYIRWRATRTRPEREVIRVHP